MLEQVNTISLWIQTQILLKLWHHYTEVIKMLSNSLVWLDNVKT